MAGEQKGKSYEALTKLVLEDLKAAKKLKGRIFYEEKPDTMTIVPDLTVGRSANAPDICILITHSGSAGDSHKKYWRNMGELVEEKVFLPAPAKVFNLAFDSVIKEDLKKVQNASFDGQLIVGDRPYGDELQAWVDANLKNFPKDKEEKVEHLREVAKKDKELKRLIGFLKKDLEALLKKKSPKELDGIWDMERKRKKGIAPARKETFVRRGLSKLLIFEDVDVALRLYSGQRVKQDEVPEYAYELGLATKAIGRALPADDEIRNAVTTLGVPAAKKVLLGAPLAGINGWLVTLRNSSYVRLMGKYVIDHFPALCDPGELERRLRALHRDPASLLAGYRLPKNWNSSTVWLFDYLMEFLKAAGQKATSYGYAQLAREVIALGYGSRSDLSAANQFGGGFGLSSWIQRNPKSGFRSDLVGGCTHALAASLGKVPGTKVADTEAATFTKLVNGLIEAKLCTYKGFDPILSLIEVTLGSQRKHRIRSAFGERAELSGAASKTTVLLSGKTIINWQSCSDAGRDHKKKELCGRASSLRYSWDAKNKKFTPRPGVKKLVLVIDGTWRQSDLDALARSGWDEIFYPDEMDKLAKAIV